MIGQTISWDCRAVPDCDHYCYFEDSSYFSYSLHHITIAATAIAAADSNVDDSISFEASQVASKTFLLLARRHGYGELL